MLNRVMAMFEYENLPETIPHKMLELYIMVNGHSVVIKHNDNLYVCFGSWGGEPNEYYLPTKYVVSNPYLNIFNTYTINEDCVLVNNDSLYYGLLPMFSRYATTLVDNDLTMHIADVNMRIASLIDAPDDKTRVSAEKYLQDIEDGKMGVIGSTALFDGIRTQPYGEARNQTLSQLIEYQQYTKASWFNEIGLNSNYNMKREAINSNESQLNDDMLLPLIDDMYNCRMQFVEKINEMFGTNITVQFASSWRDNQIELYNEQNQMSIGSDEYMPNSESNLDDNISDDVGNTDNDNNGNIPSSNIDIDISETDTNVNIEIGIGGDEDEPISSETDNDETNISNDD